MDEMINTIIGMDQKAREKTAEAESYKHELEGKLETLKENLSKEYTDKAQKEIKAAEEDEKVFIQKSLSEMDENSKTISERLEKQRADNYNLWVDSIVNNVIGR